MRLRTSLLLLGLLVIATTAAVPLWLAADNAAPHGDYVRYLTTTHRIADALSHPERDLLTRVMTAHPQPYPPLFAAIASLFHLAAPESLDAPVMSQMFFLALLGLGAFGIGRALRGPGTGLLAAFLVLTSTHAAVYGHLMMLEVPLAALTALAVWAYLESDGFRWLGPSLACGGLAGLAVLVKWNAVFALFGIAILYGFLLVRLVAALARKQPAGELSRRAVHGLGAALVAAFVIFPWAWLRLGDLWRYTENVRVQNIYHVGSGLLDPTSFLYYARSLDVELSVPLAWATGISVAALLVALTARRAGRELLPLSTVGRAGSLLTILATAYISISAIPAKESRYAGPLLPMLVPITAAVLTGFAARRDGVNSIAAIATRGTLMGLLGICGILGYLGASFDLLAGDDLRLRAVQVAQLGPLDLRMYQPHDPPLPFQPAPGRSVLPILRLKHAPDPRNPHPTRALEAIDRDRMAEKADVYAVTPQLLMHASGLTYLAEVFAPALTIHDVQEYFVSSPRDVESAAFAPYTFWTATHLIFARHRGGPTDFARARFPFTSGFSEYLDRQMPQFQKHWKRIHAYEPFADPFDRRMDFVVEVYRRIEPADDAEIAEVLDAIERFDRVKTGTWVEVAMLHSRLGRPTDALRVLREKVTNLDGCSAPHRAEAVRMRAALESAR